MPKMRPVDISIIQKIVAILLEIQTQIGVSIYEWRRVFNVVKVFKVLNDIIDYK